MEMLILPIYGGIITYFHYSTIQQIHIVRIMWATIQTSLSQISSEAWEGS